MPMMMMMMMCLKMSHDLVDDNPLDDFGDERQDRHWAVVLHLAVVKLRFLQQWRDHCVLL